MLQLLDSLDYGLGMAVLTRYTREFFHPEAVDIWLVFLAFLQSIQFSDSMVRAQRKRGGKMDGHTLSGVHMHGDA